MKTTILIWIGLWGLIQFTTAKELGSLLPRIEAQLIEKDNLFDGRWPEYTVDGIWKYRDKVNWFSGFTGGELWQMYHLSGNETLKNRALKWADALIPHADIDYTHDMGFIYMPSCVEAYRITGEEKYRDAGLRAAEMLAKRFNPNGQFIRAWGKLGTPNKAGWIIIDTMMNLDLLFWAAQESGDRKYYDMAFRHALTSLRESIRDNASSHHVVEFDPKSGAVITKHTHQGYSDESTWARGQAWGVYGFANTYKHTEYKPFLTVSMRMAEYMIDRLPEDFVPYWDLDLKGEDVLRDASAGAILASGLYLLADQVPLRRQRERYLQVADQIVESLLQNYTFLNSKRKTEQGLLIHSIYNYHKDWGVDESYPAGDYYFMEALHKYRQRLEDRKQWHNGQTRQSRLLNANWYYLEDATASIDMLGKSAAEWQCIDLPHTWNQWDATDNLPGYRRSAGWYEKQVFIPEALKHKRLKLFFEGVNISAEVFVNNKKAGEHTGGYVGFEIDITDFVQFEQSNTITVRADNSYNPDIIPSQKSDFFIYGGITRDVRLRVLPESHINNCQISTPKVSAVSATVEAVVQLDISDDVPDFQIRAEILNPAGKTVSRVQKKLDQLNGPIQLRFPEIEQPRLWSPDTPNLHRMQVQLLSNGKPIDTIDENFGLRWFEFKENGPFYLNGERLLLRGTHRHEEHAGYGAAMPNALHRRDMEMIKDMGANFVRLAHYPQDPEVYKACDELGLLVWDELPWCRGGMGGRVWKQNTERLLREQIKQNFNHPSIILWSLGNEIYWLPDFEGGGHTDSLRFFLSHLNNVAHEMDPARSTAIRKFYEGAGIVDVFSPSIWAGWYSGVYGNYEQALVDARDKYDRFLHAEYGGSSHLGRHDENPVSGGGFINPDGWEEDVNQAKVKNIARYGDWSESYIVDLFDWHLRLSESLDWFSGNAQWAFKDFGTPLRPENAIPYLNQKGLVDRAGNPKDAYYVFKSYWSDHPKFCYIESHTWTERIGPSEKARNVCVFSNCESVELYLDDQSLGKKQKDPQAFPASGLNWDVHFEAGDNALIAIGFDQGQAVTSDTVNIIYHYTQPGKPEKIVLSQTKTADGHLLVTALLVDKDGRRCLDYNKRIYFSVDGAGQLLTGYGTPTRSRVIEMANGKASIEFKAVPGMPAVIEARNQDFKGSYLIIEN